MIRSLQRSLLVLSIAALAGGGFVWGRARGLDAVPPHPRRSSSHLQTADTGQNSLLKTIGLQDDGGNANPTRTFETVLDHVQNDYALSLATDAKLSNGAIAQMLASLDDPKTSFLEPKMRAAKHDALLGHYEGIGASLVVVKAKQGKYDYRNLTILDVAPGSPAEKAGLKSGDVIDTLNGRWVLSHTTLIDSDHLQKEQKDKTKTDAELKEEAKQINDRYQKAYVISKALPLLTTGTDKLLKIGVLRPGQAAPLIVSVATAITQVEPVDFKILDKQIGLLAVRQFNAKAAEQFRIQLEKNGSDLKGLIVDLRGNPGGVRSDSTDTNGYQAAITLISLLTENANALISTHPDQHQSVTIPAARKVTAPITVLTDAGTANLAEWVASVLHDADKAKIVGAKTFGDSTLQLFKILKDGNGIEMSAAHLLNEQGKEWNGGLTPDVAATGDDTLKRALDALGA